MGEQDEVATVNTAIGDFDVATAGLRGHFWRALARPSLDGASEAARAAGADAEDLAGHRLSRDDAEGALRALEGACGLALYAATEVRPVTDHLANAGKPDLARQWQAAATVLDPHRLPADLRRDVLAALLARSPAAGLLTPPAVAEIQSALARTDADALVHLIPGHAVIVPAAGPVTHLPLPALTPAADHIERFLATLALHNAVASATRPSAVPHPGPARHGDRFEHREPGAAGPGEHQQPGATGPVQGFERQPPGATNPARRGGSPRPDGPPAAPRRSEATNPIVPGQGPSSEDAGPGSADPVVRGEGWWSEGMNRPDGSARRRAAAGQRPSEAGRGIPARDWAAANRQSAEATSAWPEANRPRPVRPADDLPDVDLTVTLQALCRWAWDAVVGPLFEHLAATSVLGLPPVDGRPEAQRFPGALPVPIPEFGGVPEPAARRRVPRVILVAAGDLARVPWAAARRGDGAYAVELMAISQAVSARMLCHNAGLPPVAPSAAGLIVADPDNGGLARELPAARLEAYAIGRSLYPQARLTGRRPDGTASPSGAGTLDQVRAWLATSNPAAGGLLHLACTGFARAGSAAYALMAGGERLTATEVVAWGARAQRRPIDLVVLAGGRTGLALSGYDEAFGLGTAFLAGGARSVLATRWTVPDAAAPALLFMTHLYRRSGRPVWAALRAAQLWMLDPGRATPPDMPPGLAAAVTRADPAKAIAWAAVTHWGR